MDSVSVSVLGHHGLSHTGDYELDITRSSPVLVATSDLFLPDDPSRPFSSFSSRAVPLDLFHSNSLIFEAPAEVSDFPHSIINMRKPGLSIRPHRPSAYTVSQSGFEDQPSPSLSHTISTVVHRLTHSPSPSRAQLPIEDPQYSPPPLDLLDDDPFGTLCTPPASAPAFRTTFAQFDSESDLYYCPSPVAPAPSPSSPHRVLSPSSLSGGKSHSKRHSSHMSISILNFPSFTAPKSASPRSHSPLSLSPSLSFSLPRMKQRRLTKSFPKPPSLSVLARVHKIGKAPTSLRAGSVGARLPVDPWEQAQVRTTGSADDTDVDAMGDGTGVVAPSWTAIARPPWMSRNIVDLPPMPGSALGLSFSIPAHPDSLLPTDTTWESFPPSVSSHGEGYMSSSPERDSPVRHRRSVSELETSDLLSPLALFDDNSAGIMAAVSAEPEPEPEPVNLTPTPALTFSGSMSERSSLDELSDEEEESGYDEDGEGEDDYDDAMPTATLCDVSRTPFNSIYGAPEDFVDTDSDTSEDEDTSNSESNDCSSYYTFEDSRDGHGEPADAGSSSGSRSRSVPRLNDPANGSSSRSNGDASGSGWAPSAGGSGNGGHGRDGDDGGRDGRRGAMPTYARDSDESESEDDVPLGRSIPTALKAQRSIRRQVRDETTERRRLRSLRLAPSPSEPPVPASAQDHLRRSATAAARPAPRDGHVPPVPHNATVRMQAAAGAQDIIAPAPVLRARARAYTLTSKAENNEQAKADELTRRLMNVQVAGPSSIRHHHPQEPRHSADEFGAPKQQQQQQSLKPMRSFHRIRPAVLDALSVPPPPAPAPLSAPAPTSSLSRASSRVRRERREYSPSKPPSSRPSLDRDEQAPTAAATSSRSRSVRRPNTAGAASTSVSSPPLPALPPSQGAFQVVSRDQPTAAATSQKLHAWQQRVYVFDLQSFHMVEIGAGTSAGDVLACLKQQGHLDSWAGVGVWTLFEACQDAGMERPLRAFEIVQDVIKSWDSSRAHNNALVARKSTMAGVLASSAIPGVSPRKSGYVEYEAKRGSWKRRWLELREQGLFLSKKDTGKDEIFLCSVSNFDAYILTAPRSGGKSKLFTFAVKSTDSVTFFENKNDYVHLFACGETEGRSWIEKIMLARSYVINQERNVIQSMPQGPTTPGALAGGSKALTRAGTVRTGMRPAQPLLDISPLPAAVAHPPPARVFEPGSLLAGR